MKHGPEHDVDDVAEPEHAHRDGRVAGAAEHRVHQEQQHHRGVAAEHHAGEAGPVRTTSSVPPISRSRSVAKYPPSEPTSAEIADAEQNRLRRRARRALGIALADAARHERRRADRQPHRERVDQRHQRLGEAHRGDGIGAEVRDPEHVGDDEDRLHRHLEHHRHGEQDDGAADGRRGVVDGRAAQRVAQSGQQAGRLHTETPSKTEIEWNERHTLEATGWGLRVRTLPRGGGTAARQEPRRLATGRGRRHRRSGETRGVHAHWRTPRDYHCQP